VVHENFPEAMSFRVVYRVLKDELGVLRVKFLQVRHSVYDRNDHAGLILLLRNNARRNRDRPSVIRSDGQLHLRSG
jgi:hypothetical protein